MRAYINHLYISPDHNYFGRYGMTSLNHSIVEHETIELVAGSGIVGDRFFDYEPDYKGQITFFDWAMYEKVVSKFDAPALAPSIFRRNVLVTGLDLNALIGKKFHINGIQFSGSCECSPCFWMDEAIGDGAKDFLVGRGGLRARILSDGRLTKGDFEFSEERMGM